MRAGIFASAHVSSGGSYRSTVLSDSPFCYFPLDDAVTATDVMGAVKPTSQVGVTMGAAGIGDGSTAASFDGGAAGRGIILPNSALPSIAGTTAFTVEVIADAVNMSAARSLFGRENMALLQHNASAALSAFTGVGWANIIDTAYTETDPTGIHHWAMTWDGATANLYRDGVMVRAEAQSGMLASITKNMYVGSREIASGTFSGTLAGFAYYTTALSASRILAHAQAAGVA